MQNNESLDAEVFATRGSGDISIATAKLSKQRPADHTSWCEKRHCELPEQIGHRNDPGGCCLGNFSPDLANSDFGSPLDLFIDQWETRMHHANRMCPVYISSVIAVMQITPYLVVFLIAIVLVKLG